VRELAGEFFVWQSRIMTAGSVLITGANRGIGLALARELAGQGWQVFAGARDPSAAHALQVVARGFPEGVMEIVGLDVCSDASVEAAFEAVSGKCRDLDVLVNNAGVFPEEGSEPLEALRLECFEEAFAVNVVGVARVTRLFLPLLGRAAKPRVINISSLAGSVSSKEDSQYYCYSASKAALNMLTRAMAAELRTRGITVVAVTPGWVKTDMGGAHAHLSVEEAARSLASTLGRVSEKDAGRFLDREGRSGEAAW
jgi:NAD(P)-dependent dehydrogenase (short-subunit alcohol dehydrogenase family)